MEELSNVEEYGEKREEFEVSPKSYSKTKNVKRICLVAFFLVLLSVLLLILFVGVVIFFIFLVIDQNPKHKAKSEVKEFLVSSESVHVEKTIFNEYIFTSLNSTLSSDIGIIYYQGGFVENAAYAPFVYELVDRLGITAILLRAPLNMAIFDIFGCDRYINDKKFGKVKNWFLFGHSLGGVVVSMYSNFHKYDKKIAGFALLGVWSPVDLSDFDGKTLLIYAEHDENATEQLVEDNKHNLPNSTVYWYVVGGNHAQMGWYTEETGGVATISKEDQLENMLNGTIQFLEGVE